MSYQNSVTLERIAAALERIAVAVEDYVYYDGDSDKANEALARTNEELTQAFEKSMDSIRSVTSAYAWTNKQNILDELYNVISERIINERRTTADNQSQEDDQ